MSFRTRLTSFFVLIVVVPMVAVGFLAFRLIGDSAQGKADARANGLATAAASLYTSQSNAARTGAQTIARNGSLSGGPALRARIASFATQAGLARVTLSSRGRVIADVGDRTALAPGIATVKSGGGTPPITVRVSTVNAAEFARDLGSSPDAGVVVRQSGRQFYSTLPGAANVSLPRRGTVSLAGTDYQAVTQSFPGFGRGLQ